MGGAQLMKRIPRIKFPQRHPRPAGSESQTAAPLAGDSVQAFFSSSKASTTLGGKASEQPPRTPVSKEEIEAILEELPSNWSSDEYYTDENYVT